MLRWLRSLAVKTSRPPRHPVLDHELTVTVAAIGLWVGVYLNTWKHLARAGKLPAFRWIDEIGDWHVGMELVILWWIAARFRLGAFVTLGVLYWWSYGKGRAWALVSPGKGLAYQFVENHILWLGVAAVGGSLVISFSPIFKQRAAEIALFLGAGSIVVIETIPNLIVGIADAYDIPAGLLGGSSAYLVLRSERFDITAPFDHFLRATGLLAWSLIVVVGILRVEFFGLWGLSIMSAAIVLFCAAFARLPKQRFNLMVAPQICAIILAFISCFLIDGWRLKLLSFLGLLVIVLVRNELPIPLTRIAEPASATPDSGA